MSVPAGNARARYIGSGSTGPFAFNFVTYDATHLTVTKRDLNGVDTTLLLNTGYTVIVAADSSSASITLVAALAGNGIDDGGSEILTIVRNPPVQQLTEWPRNDPFPSITHERAADLAVMMIGRLAEQLSRSLLLPETTTLSGLTIPPPQPGFALGWDSLGTDLANIGAPFVYVQPSAPTGIIALSSLWIDSDSADNDLFQWDGTTWVDTGVNVRGSQGIQGVPGEVPASRTLTAGTGLTGGGDLSANRSFTVDKASIADVRASALNKVLTSDLVESASAGVALVDAATVAVDWDAGVNFTLTVTANRVIGNPTNGQPGTYRTIYILGNDATDRTITFGNQFLGELPTITDCDSGRGYLLTIYCITATHFVVSSKRALG